MKRLEATLILSEAPNRLRRRVSSPAAAISGGGVRCGGVVGCVRRRLLDGGCVGVGFGTGGRSAGQLHVLR